TGLSDLSAGLRVAADRPVERAEELRVIVGPPRDREGRGPGSPGRMTCYRIVGVCPPAASKVAVARIVGARRRGERGSRAAHGLPDDEPGGGPADESEGDDGDPGRLRHAPALAGRGQNGVCQAI